MDDRLHRLSDLICRWSPSGGVHLDIGSDHGGLLKDLFRRGHISRGIAVEKRQQPFANSVLALQDLNVEVRLGDGLSVVNQGEMNSISMSGMGGRTIFSVLSARPEVRCEWLFFQPNKDADLVRRWARRSGYALVDEMLTTRLFTLIAFQYTASIDGAYDDIPIEPALHFGPILLRRRCPLLHSRLLEEHTYFLELSRRSSSARLRVRLLAEALKYLES